MTDYQSGFETEALPLPDAAMDQTTFVTAVRTITPSQKASSRAASACTIA